jgi:hypothetical protein
MSRFANLWYDASEEGLFSTSRYVIYSKKQPIEEQLHHRFARKNISVTSKMNFLCGCLCCQGNCDFQHWDRCIANGYSRGCCVLRAKWRHYARIESFVDWLIEKWEQYMSHIRCCSWTWKLGYFSLGSCLVRPGRRDRPDSQHSAVL